MSVPSTGLSDHERRQRRGDQDAASLKPFGLRIPDLAKWLGVGLTKAWELCRPDGPIETVRVDRCTIAVYESAERYTENLRRQKADQPRPSRKGLEQATTASLASRRRPPQEARAEAPASHAAGKRTGKPRFGG
jgi:hypothetical protein